MLQLYYGSNPLPWSVVEDDRYPGMWRVRSGDGTLSDMTNLTRAKDAAMTLAAVRDWKRCRWRPGDIIVPSDMPPRERVSTQHK
jgi:hypothetical protein